MAKPKLPGAKSKAKKQPSSPETAEDILAAGVEFEEAGEKWRAGDAAKSSRFFIRALEAYEGGLQRFPRSFDLAYNRARLQFDIAQQPRLLVHLPSSANELLQRALESHREALAINQEDADTLFNIGQILTALGEAVAENDRLSPGKDIEIRQQAFDRVVEAVTIFERCFSIQETRYHESKEAAASFASSVARKPVLADATLSNSLFDGEDVTSEPEKWAAIEEPVTETTLLDTCIAEMSALTAVVSLMVPSDQHTRQTVEEKFSSMLEYSKHFLAEADAGSAREFHRTGAKLSAALLSASFTLGLTPAREYAEKLDAMFRFADLASGSVEAEVLSDSAEARIAFSLAAQTDAMDGSDLTDVLQLRWYQLSQALDHLNAAAQKPNLSMPWVFHARKADVELYRSRLAELGHPQAQSNRDTLLQNAEVFYRGAKKLATAANEKDTADEMAARERVVNSLRGQTALDPALGEVVSEMREEGLLE